MPLERSGPADSILPPLLYIFFCSIHCFMPTPHVHLNISFLFVVLRFRYLFFSPAPRDANLESRYRVRQQLRLDGLSPQNTEMPVIHKKLERPKSFEF